MSTIHGTSTEPNDNTDPRRWLTLGIVILAAFIVVLDNSVLYVAIPTILREFDTTLPSLQWVITGYSLTFATFLIIGGGSATCTATDGSSSSAPRCSASVSFVASISQSVPELVIGEAVIEGIGAALMMPATLAILSGTFRGKERGTAFAMWGRHGRRGRRVRARRRWLPHHELLVAVGVPDQRDRHPDRDHRRSAVHAEGAPR
jgi:hypothetical protein